MNDAREYSATTRIPGTIVKSGRWLGVIVAECSGAYIVQQRVRGVPWRVATYSLWKNGALWRNETLEDGSTK